MTVNVQLRRPIVQATRVLVGAPVAAAQQWTDVAHAAMWCRGKGAMLVPACSPMEIIKTTSEQVFRFRIKPRSSAVQRVWNIVVQTQASATFTTTALTIRAPAATGTAQAATASGSGTLTPIVYVEDLASKNTTEAEISIGITSPGADASSGFIVATIACYEQDRPVLSEDATDVPTLIETVRPGEPIGSGTRISMAGVLASLAAMDARRVGIYHFSVATPVSRLSATPADLLSLPVYVQGPKVARAATTQSVKWAVYAGMSAGGGGGAVAISTAGSSVSDSISVTSATPAWIDGGTVSILCDDFTQADGQVDDAMTITIAGDGTRSINLYALSMWVEDVS